ncbi:MAG TPA: NAD(P)-binding oxidoreductase [Polyangiaceae bacterium]|nr:NAD(P)-binding oxidoreductase [Polyangiaceae bacterium]
MRLLVLGATGRTGVELIDLALPKHDVTAFVRSPARVTRTDGRLRVVKGDVRDSEQLAAALAGHDAVISALGPKVGDALFGTTPMKDAAVSTLDAMRIAGVRRFLVVSSAILFPGGGIAVGFFRGLIGHHLVDSRRMEELVAQSAVEWTIARPPRLVMTRDEGYVAEEGKLPGGLTVRAAMSWRAVAAFLLHAVEGNLYPRRVVGLVSHAA